jgi:SAM-dependent methyltransferase
MKSDLRNIGVAAGVLLALWASNSVLAEENAGQVAGAPKKKMHVAGYDRTARGINALIYAYYAEQIKKKTGITKGTCLDVGCGGGYLGLALARITDLHFIFLDISPEMLEKANLHIAEDGLHNRARTLLADVHRIPLPDASVDLVISRGSIPFWKDPATALKEIYRVLAPGGRAYVGGGRGTAQIREQIAAKRKEMGKALPDRWKKGGGPPHGRMAHRNYDEILKSTGIPNFSISKGDDGMWIQMWR